MRTITLEEHFVSPGFMKGPGLQLGRLSQFTEDVIDRLSGLDDSRIAEMDAAGIDTQVLSLLSPGVEQLDADDSTRLAEESNDFLAEAVGRHSSRLFGFAAVPTPAPEAAADELERMVRGHGFKGALINGHCRGRYLDDRYFWPILERAEALGVPLYIHPAVPPEPVVRTYYEGNHSAEVTARFAAAGWGWHIETAVHVLRIILSGAIDRYPRLQLLVGHLGEGLPFMMERLDSVMPTGVTKLERPIGDYLRKNLSYTFSGFNYLPTFLELLQEVGAGRIMFSVDYPFGSMAKARSFLEKLPVSPSEREAIAHLNAERLLRL